MLSKPTLVETGPSFIWPNRVNPSSFLGVNGFEISRFLNPLFLYREAVLYSDVLAEEADVTQRETASALLFGQQVLQ